MQAKIVSQTYTVDYDRTETYYWVELESVDAIGPFDSKEQAERELALFRQWERERNRL